MNGSDIKKKAWWLYI